MIKLRRVLVATRDFLYSVEFVEFLPWGKVRIFTDEIHCGSTEMRRLIDTTHFEVLLGTEWVNCSEKFYHEYIQNHSKLKLRKKRTAEA